MNLKVIGVTGTNGKTTVSYMLKSIFEAHGMPCGIVGTTGHSFGKLFWKAANTTPGEELLKEILDEMERDGAKRCIMEVSSHGLDQGRVKNIPFEYGIFTNLTQDHLDYHKTMENYFQAKQKLFLMTSKGNVINGDDSYGHRIAEATTGGEMQREKIKMVTYSLKDKNADYYCEIAETTERGSKFSAFKNREKIGDFDIHIPGVFMIYNALASIACADLNGVGIEAIKSGLENLQGVPGRFQLVENEKGITAAVDYAHTPDALEKLLKAASEFCKGRLICVFGCGGDRDREKRPLMGKAAGTYCDYAIITSDNPRTEDKDQITREIEIGIRQTDCGYEIIPDRLRAIQRAAEIYTKDDMIIVAGKGHEDYQIIGTEKTHFDDVEVLKEIIENYGE